MLLAATGSPSSYGDALSEGAHAPSFVSFSAAGSEGLTDGLTESMLDSASASRSASDSLTPSPPPSSLTDPLDDFLERYTCVVVPGETVAKFKKR